MLKPVNLFTLDAQTEQYVQFCLTGSSLRVRVYVLTPTICRVLCYHEGAAMPRVYTVAPNEVDVPPDGRDRLVSVASTDFRVVVGDGVVDIATSMLSVRVSLDGLRMSWTYFTAGVWQPLFSDRATQCYNFSGELGRGVFHYVTRRRSDVHFGLGEKAGNVVKTGGSYRFCNIDCMGYDAKSADPLYKHIPYYLTKTETACYALYYDTYADARIDLGRELDNYHGLYQYFWADDTYLDYYVLAGDQVQDIVPAFARLGGVPALPPRWSLGYLGSTMSYTDSVDPVPLLNGFADKCDEHQIPCTGFHLSSGYTSIGKKRYVFHWNREKFPDIAAFCSGFAARGIHLIGNIKPCLLTDHPQYNSCAAQGLFVTDGQGNPELSQFWDGLGSFLDFTNPDTCAWWRRNVTEALLQYGITTWNDNNEFEIWDERARCHGSGGVTAATALRPLLTLLMLRTSNEAQTTLTPQERPFLISRAGCLGMQRYAQTWTGDNYTCWDTLRYNHKMGVGLSLSGVFNFGHDVGGFAGPKPEGELFVRWIQHGIFMPRFSIHSWNDDATANEPWMHPAALPAIQSLLAFRYRLLPYLYQLLYRAHTAYAPMVCPVFYCYPDAPYESDLYLLGTDMLVANVFDPAITELAVQLPHGDSWYALDTETSYQGGQVLRCRAGINDPVPVFVRAGAVIPMADDADGIVCHIYPLPTGVFTDTLFADDGVSPLATQSNYLTSVTVDCQADSITITQKGQEARFVVHDKRPIHIIKESVTC